MKIEPRDKVFGLRLSPKEFDKLSRLAEKYGHTPSAYLRFLLQRAK